MITEQEMEQILNYVLVLHTEENEESPIDPEIWTFADMGVMSKNHGLVVTADNGESEFQITIVRSR